MPCYIKDGNYFEADNPVPPGFAIEVPKRPTPRHVWDGNAWVRGTTVDEERAEMKLRVKRELPSMVFRKYNPNFLSFMAIQAAAINDRRANGVPIGPGDLDTMRQVLEANAWVKAHLDALAVSNLEIENLTTDEDFDAYRAKWPDNP